MTKYTPIVLFPGHVPKDSRLTLLECLEVQGVLQTKKYVKAECLCGNQVILTEHSFKYSIVKSCGCLKRKNKIPKRKIYGKFKLLSPTEEKDSSRHIIWLVQCVDCMELLTVTLSNLKAGRKIICKKCNKLNL